MLQDTFKVTGNVLLRRYDENGFINLEREHKNLVVTTGKQLIASRMVADSRAAISGISITGTGSVATVTYTAQTVIPYEVGSYVSISGSGAYNGTYRVITASTTQITITSTLNTSVSGGQIDSLYNGTIKTMRIGQSNTVANLSDTALINEIASVNLFSSQVNVNDTAAEIIYVALFPAGTGTSETGIAEAALMNVYNKMLCRTVFPLITKSPSESLEIFWTITIN